MQLEFAEPDSSAARTEALAHARELIAEAESTDGASPVSDQAMLAAAQGQRRLMLFTLPHPVPITQEPIAHEPLAASAPVAVAIVGEGELDLVVRPTGRGRGVGTAALHAALKLADRSAELRAWAHGDNPVAERLLGDAGFAPVRSLYLMQLDPALLPSDGRDPLATPTPDDLTLRAFDPQSPDDAGAWVRANAAAFATHPEQGRVTEADFALIRAEAWFDPGDLILLAQKREQESGHTEFAGSTWIKTVRTDADGGVDAAACARTECELYAVGVRPEFTGRGLGKLLLDATLARMAQHQPQRVTLYVDGENEAAVRMYERASFTIASRSRHWALPALEPAPSPANARIVL